MLKILIQSNSESITTYQNFLHFSITNIMYTSYREEKSNQKEFVLISKSLHFHKKLASNIAKHFGRFVAA